MPGTYISPAEIRFYYLQSRYYDPEVCRFINSDDVNYIGATESEISYNPFAYCENEPVKNSDPMGTLSLRVKNLLITVRGLLTSALFSWICNLTSFMTLSLSNILHAIYNYNKNRSQRKQPNGYIKDQERYVGWRLGVNRISNCGCEIIAVYNVLRKLGKSKKLQDLILASEISGYVMLFGLLGSSPTSLWRLFSSFSLKYSMTYNVNTINERGKKSNAIIISCWNKGSFSGLHTFMVLRSNNKYYSYNGYNDTKGYDSIQELLNGRKFIIGYCFY